MFNLRARIPMTNHFNQNDKMSNSFSAKTSKSSVFCLIFYHFFCLKHKENNDTFINLKKSKKLILDNNLNLTNKKPRYLTEIFKNERFKLCPFKKDFRQRSELKLFTKPSFVFSIAYSDFTGKEGVLNGEFQKKFLRPTALKYKAYIGGERKEFKYVRKVEIRWSYNFYVFQSVSPGIRGVVRFEPYPFYIRIYTPLYPPISPYSTISFILFIRKVEISNNGKCNLLKNQKLAFLWELQLGKSQKSRLLSNFLINKKLSLVTNFNFFVTLFNFILITLMQAFENQKFLMKNPKNVMLYLSLFFSKNLTNF